MTKRSEIRKIEIKKKEWDKSMAWFNNGIKNVFYRVKRFFRKEMEAMMYGTRPKDAVDRFEHAFFWWAKLLIILFALKGVGII
jgi:hypothetical protein